MTVKELIEALTMCHPDAEVEFSVDFERDGALVAIEHEVIGNREHNPEDVGCVYLHNTKNDFTHDEPLCHGNLFIT
jgi:hypothetical protein